MNDSHEHSPQYNNPPEEQPNDSTPPHDTEEIEEIVSYQNVSFERVEKLLTYGEIVEDHGRVRWSSNYTMLLSVKDEDLESLAIYKPQRGERPLWDFPDGTLCYREVAAYEVSKSLGWDLVAPTVLRDANSGLGSVQLFVHHDPEITYFQLSDNFLPELQKMATFDVLVNNTDRKGGHCLVDGEGKLWAIDHGICFHTHPKLRTVIWDFAGQPIADELLVDIEELCGKLDDSTGDFFGIMKSLLSEMEIDAFRSRIRHLLKRRTYPVPGSGPNYPWPAV